MPTTTSMTPPLIAEPSKYTQQGRIDDQGELGVMVGELDVLALFRERRGIAAVETCGGGERVPIEAKITVEFPKS